MRILVDKEGEKALQELVNIALKVGGIENLGGVNAILSVIEPLKEEAKAEECDVCEDATPKKAKA